MSFSIFNSDIIFCSSEKIITFNCETKKECSIELPKLIVDKDIKSHNKLDFDTCHGITSVTFSSDGQYYCVCTNRKQLCLYKYPDNVLVSNRTLSRAASKVQFTPKNDIVVADKSGDVYLYRTNPKSFKKPDEPDKSDGILILGHLSMLLDVLVTENNLFIITADRDEKIRVSRFPNSYNIESYCLGHTKFINNISELPHDKNILVSTGGDGDFKFWNYIVGEELKSVSYSDQINEDDVKRLNENLKKFDLATEEITAIPVKHMRLMKLDDLSSILALSFYGNGDILFYIIVGTFPHELKINFVQKITNNSEPLECIFYNRQFWILFDDGLKVYKYEHKHFVDNVEFNKVFENFNKSWTLLRSKVNEASFYPILYKRKFDSVQEYQERKKSRLMNLME
ncbi:tRNA (guanine-N(7)-)-methyltransferase non-catalytic subunit WDR4 [Chelonus insularis]|uniref:tRNA (guanine-N(7)-)-methyltransferase non-catalytic subunit WDR4 n=1 Tax=Chelonus insularis TaxID=460826 RepID=UPI00158CF07D|nr:tRNA (guanine-N(7)-)-methyltransferase non-catalytic subunit WDR4 [Chelonus insularis]